MCRASLQNERTGQVEKFLLAYSILFVVQSMVKRLRLAERIEEDVEIQRGRFREIWALGSSEDEATN